MGPLCYATDRLGHVVILRQCCQTKAMPRHLAGGIAGQARSTNRRPYGVHITRREYTDIAHQGRAAVPFASHTPLLVVDQRARD
jgi:hypothetical protein